MVPSQTAISDLAQAVHDALRLWHDDRSPVSPFDSLYVLQSLRRASKMGIREATNAILESALKELGAERPADADLLRMKFVARKATHVVAGKTGASEGWVFKLQRDAIARLADKIAAQEAAARGAQDLLLRARLDPPTYSRLIGGEAHLRRLSQVVDSESAPLLAITGLGGIGKTSLADALLRRLLRTAAIDDFGWVSARQQMFHPGGAVMPVKRPVLTADGLIIGLARQMLEDSPIAASLSVEKATALLQARLQGGQRRTAIVVDNLETLSDVQDLLPVLRRLAGPTVRFILTSRDSLHDETDVFPYVLQELKEPDALELIREEAGARNLPALQSATDAALHPIFACVGGNPLALRLIVGQAHVHPLGAILRDLADKRGPAASVYAFIYDYAFAGLDPVTRKVFVATAAATRGTAAELAAITELDIGTVRDSINLLVGRSLVDCRSDGLGEQHYSIHTLTRAYLHQVAQW